MVVGGILLEDRVHEVAGERQRRRYDETAVGIEECGEVILLFTDEGRHRRAADEGLHLGARGAERALDELERDGAGRRR